MYSENKTVGRDALTFSIMGLERIRKKKAVMADLEEQTKNTKNFNGFLARIRTK
jgi:predicted ATPase with chaperone activity